ncbi:MAG: hypothetical protein V4726_17920 [Verrucomicrobiota bacterium]
MPGSPVPTGETELVPWLINFSTKLAGYEATLGFQPGETSKTREELEYMVHLLNVLIPSLRKTLGAAVEFKSLMKDGEPSARMPDPLPGTVLPAAFTGTPPPPGVLTRLRRLVQNIKTRPGYTETIGQNLGMIGTVGGGGPEAPTLTVISVPAGAVTIGWNKSGWTGVKVQARKSGTESWEDLGVDLYSPFVDTRPLSLPNQPENREYRACYLDGDTAQADWSQVLALTVAP